MRGDVAFQPKAIIRTILRDVAPGELAGGATLFQEHLIVQRGIRGEARYDAVSRCARRSNTRSGRTEAGREILVDNPRRFLAFVPKHPRGKV